MTPEREGARELAERERRAQSRGKGDSACSPENIDVYKSESEERVRWAVRRSAKYSSIDNISPEQKEMCMFEGRGGS